MKPLAMIAAIARNGAIGRGGGLPWSYPEDRAHFERTTRGHAVIMGRRTWDEEARPLAERTSIVVSRTFVPPPSAAGAGEVRAARSLDEALAIAWSVDPAPFVIGGARIFAEALPRVTRIYLTEIPTTPPADVMFVLDRRGFAVVGERAGADGVRFLVLERATRAPGGGFQRHR